LAGFSKSLFQKNRARLAHSQLILEQAQYTVNYGICESHHGNSGWFREFSVNLWPAQDELAENGAANRVNAR
jgi:hypothetical protein